MDLMVNPTITGFRQDVDGTIKELKLGEEKQDAYANIIEQGSSDLEDNKAATINVSTYTEPVEITPTEGKDGMKKTTVTLSNIPSGGGTLYAWKDELDNVCYTTSATPTTNDYAYDGQTIGEIVKSKDIVAVGEGTISREGVSDPNVYSRYATGDISLT